MFRSLKVLLPLLAGAALATGFATPALGQAPAAAPTGVQLDSLAIRGNERIEASTIRVVSTLQEGVRTTSNDIQTAIRRLMATGNFETVRILSEGAGPEAATLVIEVVERPFIVGYDIEGLERVSTGTVRDTVGLVDNGPLDPQAVKETEQTIRDMLGRQGVQLASLDTTMVPVEGQSNSYRIVFHVEEGNRLAIADIEIEGNQAFSDEDVKEAMSTKEEGFFWFRPGRYDRETYQEDLVAGLPTFYGQNGYIDFAVVSDSLIIDPQSGKARLVIEVDEGQQYRLGQFSVEGASRFPTDQLERMFTVQRRSVLGLPFGGRNERVAGDVFDQGALDAATASVRQLYNNEGYLYAQISPVVQRAEAEDGTPVVNVTWAISENSPFYINRVVIEGNTYTHESVIRDRLVVYPGDIYSEDRLIQSYRSIGALGFFETPGPMPDIRPNVEAGTVDIIFRVEEKSTGSINFGTALGGGGAAGGGGLSGFLGYSQPNLFGQAKQANLQAEYGYGRSSFTASYTDPALLGSRNSGSISLFHTDDRYRQFSFSDGRYVRTGGSLRYGFPFLNFRWTRAFAGYSLSRYRYEIRDEADCEVGSIFCQDPAVSSQLSFGLTRDTKDHPLFPSTGTSQSLSLSQTGGFLGGDGNFQKLTANADWWIPVGRFGGGEPGTTPIIVTFGLTARTGAVFGRSEDFPFERFFLGGTQFGQALRGYDESSITPIGFVDKGNASFPSSGRLGDAFFSITGEYAIRFTDALSVSIFGDAGNIWNEPATFNPSRLYRSIGVGASVVTPFGPLGLDYAYGFDAPTPGWKFHFKINQPGF